MTSRNPPPFDWCRRRNDSRNWKRTMNPCGRCSSLRRQRWRMCSGPWPRSKRRFATCRADYRPGAVLPSPAQSAQSTVMICAAAGIRRGSGSESRARREDGADDHPLGNRKLGVCSGGNLPAEAQSPHGAAASTDLFGAEALWLRQESFGSGCFRLRYYILNSGIARIMNSSNSGTVNAMSPCAGL